MSVETSTRRLGKVATLAAAAVALGTLVIPLKPADAQIYLGWDFGNGFGIGIGVPPSAYERCPNYGFGPQCYYPYHRPYYRPYYPY